MTSHGLAPMGAGGEFRAASGNLADSSLPQRGRPIETGEDLPPLSLFDEGAIEKTLGVLSSVWRGPRCAFRERFIGRMSLARPAGALTCDHLGGDASPVH